MTLKEEIDILDSKVTRLKTEYEQYFMGILKREPVRLREDIERIILRWAGRSITNTGLKFKLESIIARFTAYKQYWTRVLRAIEDGTYARRSETSYMRSSRSPEPERGKEREEQEAASSSVDNLSAAYEKYMETRKSQNKNAGSVSYEKFVDTVKKSLQKAKETYHLKEEDMEVDVSVKDGKTRVVIKPRGR